MNKPPRIRSLFCPALAKGIRWPNLLMVFLLFTFIYIRFPSLGMGSESLWLVVSAVLIMAGANLENDWHDRHTDLHNRKFNWYLSGKECGPWASYLFYAGGLLSGWYFIRLRGFSPYCISCVAAVIILLMLYNRTIKKMPLIGNVIISSLMVFLIMTVIIFYPAPVGVQKKLLFIAIWLFLINLNREIIKDFQDRKGDRRNRYQTLPVLSPRLGFQMLYANILMAWINMLAYINSVHLHITAKIYFLLILLYMTWITYRWGRKYLFRKLSLHYKIILLAGMTGILLI